MGETHARSLRSNGAAGYIDEAWGAVHMRKQGWFKLNRAVGRRVAVVLLAGGVGAILAPAVSASTGGYPHSGAADCSRQFGVYSWCVDENRNGRFTDEEQYSPLGFSYRNCTDWVAWRINSLGVGFHNTMGGRQFGNASNWDDNARQLGWHVSAEPVARSIGVRNGGFGHVAFVESVNGDGSVNVSEYNRAGTGVFANSTGRFDAYVHVPGLTAQNSGEDLGRYRNTLVRWDGDDRTTWFVTPDLKRLWIPDGGTYSELKSRGFKGPFAVRAETLDRMPDMRNYWVASGSQWTGNRTLRRDMSVRSSDGRYLLSLQGDGNLVLVGPSGRVVWATDRLTANWRGQEYVVFQPDGNLVTYGGGRAIWASNTAGSRADRFVVQNDGNLVIYRGSTPVWASQTAGRS